MSTPPPDGWPPGPPPNPGQPYGQQGFNPQQPAGWQQGSWPQQAGPPPQKGSGLKWLLIAVAVLLVVAISVGATLIFTRDSGGGGGASPSSAAANEFASAGDTGPVGVIASEPTCQAYLGISTSVADLENTGWGEKRDTLGPSSEWSPEQRHLVQSVAQGMRNAAEQVKPLVSQTPHRLVREMYEQYIAYGRAYADSVGSYVPANNYLASANVNIGAALTAMCNSITYGSTERATRDTSVENPTNIQPGREIGDLGPFITSEDDATCRSWVEQEQKFVSATSDWSNLDAAIPASDWTPEERAVQQSVMPTLSQQADFMEEAGRQSGNRTLEDFAVAGAIYIKAYLTAGDSYVKADGWLSNVAFRLNNAIASACQSSGN